MKKLRTKKRLKEFYLVKELELKIYQKYNAEHMLALDIVNNLKELKEFCEGYPYIYLIEDYGYCLYTKKEIVDFASLKPLSLKQINELYIHLKEFYKSKTIKTDCKKDTSYKIIKFMERRNKIKIIKEQEWFWEETEMIEMELKIL